MIGLYRWKVGKMMIIARAAKYSHTGCILHSSTNHIVPGVMQHTDPRYCPYFIPFTKISINCAPRSYVYKYMCVCVGGTAH